MPMVKSVGLWEARILRHRIERAGVDGRLTAVEIPPENSLKVLRDGLEMWKKLAEKLQKNGPEEASLINNLILEIQNEIPQLAGLERRSNQRSERLGKRGKPKRKIIVDQIDEDTDE